MSKEMYNLQIPIDKGMAEQLKVLADEDDRSLRAFCRNILKQYLKDEGVDYGEAQNEPTTTEKQQKSIIPPNDKVAKNSEMNGYVFDFSEEE